ncbi:MAG: hypothetical protein ACR2KL_08275 [Nocardioidaceae bacterium]
MPDGVARPSLGRDQRLRLEALRYAINDEAATSLAQGTSQGA